MMSRSATLKEMRGSAVTPAASYLLQVNSTDPVVLGKEHTDVFVRTVMQLCFSANAVSFLNSRLVRPDEDDYKKLTRVVRYLESTIDLPLVLAADASGQIRWWVDFVICRA
jgi:hypothetical protein